MPDAKHPHQKRHSRACRRAAQQAWPMRRAYTYRMTPVELRRLAEEQNYRCALCQKLLDLTLGDRGACVDHLHECSNPIHATDRQGHQQGCADCVRGLICHFCNMVTVRFLEAYPTRQTEAERAYFDARPIRRYREAS